MSEYEHHDDTFTIQEADEHIKRIERELDPFTASLLLGISMKDKGTAQYFVSWRRWVPMDVRALHFPSIGEAVTAVSGGFNCISDDDGNLLESRWTR